VGAKVLLSVDPKSELMNHEASLDVSRECHLIFDRDAGIVMNVRLHRAALWPVDRSAAPTNPIDWRARDVCRRRLYGRDASLAVRDHHCREARAVRRLRAMVVWRRSRCENSGARRQSVNDCRMGLGRRSREAGYEIRRRVARAWRQRYCGPTKDDPDQNGFSIDSRWRGLLQRTSR
jgi:hypothetical protein